MVVIKRYQNRKLYCTKSHCYILIEDIAKMVRQGVEFKVVDNKTREDLTKKAIQLAAFHTVDFSQSELESFIKR